jgi:hypothetical protein
MPARSIPACDCSLFALSQFGTPTSLRLRRYDGVDVLESENRDYEGILLSARIVAGRSVKFLGEVSTKRPGAGCASSKGAKALLLCSSRRGAPSRSLRISKFFVREGPIPSSIGNPSRRMPKLGYQVLVRSSERMSRTPFVRGKNRDVLPVSWIDTAKAIDECDGIYQLPEPPALAGSTT